MAAARRRSLCQTRRTGKDKELVDHLKAAAMHIPSTSPELEERLVFSQPRGRAQRGPTYSRTWSKSREDARVAQVFVCRQKLRKESYASSLLG